MTGNKRLGLMLAEERRRAGISQIELSKKFKRSQTFVTRMERGKRPLTIPEFVALCRIIGCDPLHVFRSWLKER